MKKILSVILAIACMFSFAACDNGNNGGNNGASGIDYEYVRESENNILKFSSSDEGLDNFLNDYFHRHARYDSKRIDSRDLGSAVTFGKEWEAYSLMFFDSTESAFGISRQNMIKNYIDGVPVDRFGYVWNAYHAVQENDTDGNVYFHQGWPFPAYSTVGNAGAKGWEFANGQTGGWTVTLNGADYAASVETNASGDGKLVVQSDNISEIVFVSPENANINCARAPFLEFDIRFTDTGTTDRENSFIEDLEVRFIREGESWDNAHSVSYGEFCTTGDMNITPSFNRHIYFPMYLNEDWGKSGTIKQFKLVVKTKDTGKARKGNFKLNFVRAQFDTRQTNNIGIFLSAAQKYLEFSGDSAALERNLSRFRSAAQFLIGYCNGESGLIDRGGFVGHEGSKSGIGTSIGNGYWDMLSTPTVSLYANLFFYRAIQSMLYIERMAQTLGITQDMPEVWNKTASGYVSYNEQMTVTALEELLEKIREKIQEPVNTAAETGFWDESKGRFIEGFDSDGDAVDYGYVMYNLEAIETGVATAEQAKKILDWVNGDRIVEADKVTDGDYPQDDEQSYATGKKGSAVQADGYVDSEGTLGIYDYEFAPRTSTVKNHKHYYWDWTTGESAMYAEQLQDGGATMYVSYYDIMSRIDTRGADDAFARLKEIQAWYEKVREAAKAAHEAMPDGGYDGVNFYRAYYDQKANLQGNGEAGTLGLDCEFLESSMLYATVPYGFFGISGSENNALSVEPKVPANLDWWKMENLLYRGVRYDLTVMKNSAQIDYVRGDTDGLYLSVTLAGGANSKIYMNGTEQETAYDKDSGTVTAKVPFKACKLTVK